MSIYLRELERSDLPIINRWRADRDLVRTLGSPFRHVGQEVDARWFEQYQASRANNVRLAICGDDAASPLGVVYLINIDWLNRHAEFAIQIGQAGVRRKGYGEEASRQILRHAFADLNLNRIHLTVLQENQAAIGLYRKLGFVEEGVQRAAVFKDGHYANLVNMAILASEWPAADYHLSKRES